MWFEPLPSMLEPRDFIPVSGKKGGVRKTRERRAEGT